MRWKVGDRVKPKASWFFDPEAAKKWQPGAEILSFEGPFNVNIRRDDGQEELWALQWLESVDILEEMAHIELPPLLPVEDDLLPAEEP